ncbi:hypothetical protein MmiHf6_02240 [Methanimicrococcus hongohii]|uniref:Uncharacterized protein n=1 Tax=Methanimicrococcus hongohii TaxID=3028295 RepID=A0AA96UYE4_9EURY|nr:hypothetical protein [Methanimicrococcus sp. Hf6]WNY22931.1 hypothetical protein MmiHf6_02240 [Methanimicrococcus sp. Hf6]
MTNDDQSRPFDKECNFTKVTDENMIKGVLSVIRDMDNEAAVVMDGNRDLSSVIPGIQNIQLERDKGIIYHYRIHVFGHCPDEYKKINLFFKDGEDKVHKMFIISGHDKWHTEKYNSEKPDIFEISWEVTE